MSAKIGIGVAGVAALLLLRSKSKAVATPKPGIPVSVEPKPDIPVSVEPKPGISGLASIRWYSDGPAYAWSIAPLRVNADGFKVSSDGSFYLGIWDPNVQHEPLNKIDSLIYKITGQPNQRALVLLEVEPPYRIVLTESTARVKEFCSLGVPAPKPATLTLVAISDVGTMAGRFALWVGDSITMARVLSEL